jgi:flagellar biosynthesis protein FlhF
LGLHHDFVEQLIQRAQASLSEKELKDPATVWHFIQKSLADWIHVYDAIFNGGVQKKRIAMIGPTGVGKTTTLAKLAAQYMLYKNTNIAMVTIDHYRIAAVEQLKVYGEIMNIPVEVAFTCEELGNILNDYRHKDLILIDTAGRSPRNSQEMEELRSILTPFDTIEGHLVLSATTREEELFDILKSFHILSPKSTIFTKLDECDFLGSILNVHLCHDYPISYLANGQRVPEDLVFAEPRVITELVMKSTKGQDL